MFFFSSCCRCLILTCQKTNLYDQPKFHQRTNLVFNRQLAYACQVEILEKPGNIKWSEYDLLIITNFKNLRKFSRPKLPIIIMGIDFWEQVPRYQWILDWLKPDILLTPYPHAWKENFKIPSQTDVVFYPLFDSSFFARPSLNKKKIDLLVIGAAVSSPYNPRKLLIQQISKLPSSYKIEVNKLPLYLFSKLRGNRPTYFTEDGKAVRFLNKWSEYLSSAKYVIFGRMKYPILVAKYYEVLGSGAVPIFPETEDLKLLGVQPFKHYIPISEVENNPEKLRYFLDRYEDYKYIAQNAISWHQKNSDKMLFEDFENMIRKITDYKYPKRII